MASSLGLTAYRALARRGEPAYAAPDAHPPRGELVWLHIANRETLIAAQDLALRLINARPGTHVLITLTVPPPPNTPTREGLHFGLIPDDHPESVQKFFEYWQPDTCFWFWGDLHPNLLLAMADSGKPMFLIDADAKGFDGRRDRWLPDVSKSLLPLFSTVMTRNAEGARRLTQLGLPRKDIDVTTPLLAGGQALSCNETDEAELSQALVGRAVWFANAVQEQELSTVLAAHRHALRLSHRLLLLLRPAGDLTAQAAADHARVQDFRVLSWADGEYPDESTQILLTDDAEDIGLFYRLAPVSFLGTSLTKAPGACDPLEAAALGSAVLYGPKVGRHLQSYSRLASAGAARIINDGVALGNAISRLVAPDQAALMAHAGWDVVSQGAALTDRIIDLAQDALDVQMGLT
ncbi:3-deoxy-D-manno-octulosonic acid transferase [Sulfitobacter sp. S190]|uniref:3-deoxy-D-manno-octulosonic acid transferase n=1 Tax=Sulfitobacter sp. S190 TaxID=2867022 RepID=UPI0021A6D93B|nr:glycosyltransferase N-terminal domain-containing protein [Sulfitobacter sp. S190]UWR22264.1 3-deoxy-D-manno-octulosonic acid transferase [Sulfitobacter sp. S190]